MKVIFGRPANFDPHVRGELEAIFIAQHPEVVVSHRMRSYILGQLVVVSLLLFFLILWDQYWPFPLQVGGGVFVLLSLINIGAILEKKTWVLYLEYARLCSLILTAYALTNNPWWLLTLNLASIVILFTSNYLRRQYVHWVYNEAR
ncbi:hypothetical protein [Siphonobacter sp. BAB-5385]|uniref:hypothetical protein n=1 Tax=Siphonobacter sp. BAB-5385 TaxID=1864822 RepID=UPI0020CCDCF4|nr:hypothetical protein [Siphonobacter sp. BAB-5385]